MNDFEFSNNFFSTYSKFVKHIAALKDYKWALAGAEARDSRWYSQVGDRAERLCQRLEAL